MNEIKHPLTGFNLFEKFSNFNVSSDKTTLKGTARSVDYYYWYKTKDSGNDLLLGKDTVSDTIYGLSGDDYINGQGGDDTIYGHADNDTLVGGKGKDVLSGGDGDDVIYGGKPGENYDSMLDYLIDGGTFSDVDFLGNNINGGEGNDSIYGSFGQDTIYGDDGNDSIRGGDGQDTIYGGVGDDELYGGAGDDYIEGGAGSNEMHGGSGNDTINAGADGGYIYGDSGDDSIIGGDGFDFVSGDEGNDYIDGKEDDDLLMGGKGNDSLLGGAGNDTIEGNKGDDALNGGAGNDTLYGGIGKNTFRFDLEENGESDTVIYEADSFTYDENGYPNGIAEGEEDDYDIYDLDKNIYKGVIKDGDDLIIEYESADGSRKGTVKLKDYYKYRDFKNDDIIKDASGTGKTYHLREVDGVDGFYDSNVPSYSLGIDEDKKNSFKGKGNTNDRVTGGNLTDTFHGGDGDDYFNGGIGNDKLYGDAGNDTIVGGIGDDKLYGGAGINTYTFSTGDGRDMLYIDKKSEKETLDFTGVVKSFDDIRQLDFNDLKFSSKGNDLIITYNEAGDSVTLSGYLKNIGTKNEKDVYLKFLNYLNDKDLTESLKDGSINIDFTGNKDKKNSIKGSKFGDYIVGGDQNDTLKGNDGNDKIVGGFGNDKLYGGNSTVVTEGTGAEKGGNAFWFEKRSGNDTLYYTKPGKNHQTPRDFIVFKTVEEVVEGKDEPNHVSTLKENSSFSRHNNDLIIEYNDGSDSLTVKDYYKRTDWELYFDHADNVEEFRDKYEANTSGKQKLSDIFVRSTKGSFENKFLSLFSEKPKNVKGDVYEGTASNEALLSSGSNAWLEGGAGNDYYSSSSKYAYAYDESGNDQYFADNFTKGIFEIKDDAGNDQLIIDENSGDIHVFFDVSKDFSIESGNDLYLFGDKVFDTFSKGKVKPSNFKGVVVYDGIKGSGLMEQVESSDGKYLDENLFNKIKEDVQSWLKDTDYNSAMDVLERGSKDDINHLLELYESAGWSNEPQPAEALK